jgi:hypothetical protein
MKEETKPSSTPSNYITTPDTCCADTEAEAENSNSGEGTQGSGDTSAATLPQTETIEQNEAEDTSSVVPPASSPQFRGATSDSEAGTNLVGRINNYVSTDLGNITDGRDFLFVGKLG